MNCEQAHNLFDGYLDGGLDGALATEFAAHKLNCPACRRELALLEVAGHVIAADTEAPLLGAEFSERLLACATKAPTPWYRRPRFYVGPPLAVAACVALLLFFPYERSAPSTPAGNALAGPSVLGEREVVDSPAKMLEKIESAASRNPGDLELQKRAEALRARVREIAADTREGASALENFGKMTIMEILESIRIDSPRNEEKPSPAGEPSGQHHDPPVEDL